MSFVSSFISTLVALFGWMPAGYIFALLSLLGMIAVIITIKIIGAIMQAIPFL